MQSYCSTDSSPKQGKSPICMFLVTYNVLGSGNCSYTVLIDRSRGATQRALPCEATQTRGVRQSLILGRGSASLHGIKPREENACDICSLQAVSVLGLRPRKLPDRSPSRDSARPGRSRSATERRAFERTLGLAPA